MHDMQSMCQKPNIIKEKMWYDMIFDSIFKSNLLNSKYVVYTLPATASGVLGGMKILVTRGINLVGTPYII